MLPLFLPPWATIRAFISSLEMLKLPEITMILPFKVSDRACGASSVSNCRPAAFSLAIVSRFISSLKYLTMLSAMTSPTSSTSNRVSRLAFFILSMLPKCLAMDFAVVSPTYLIPNAYRTLSKGTFLDSSMLLRKRSADLSFHPSRVRRCSFVSS